MTAPLRAPFPWFGGKSRAAHLVWAAFGDVPNYVEPFAGSLAVLLRRPTAPKVETVNDLDCYLTNFWRAVQGAPEEVAAWADWPVSELDLHARHRWLVGRVDFRERLRAEPDFFDAKVAGWWVWGLSQWIGSGWCAQPAWENQAAAGAAPAVGCHTANWEKRPTLSNAGQGINRPAVRSTGKTCGIQTAEYSKRPMLDKPGRGIHQLAARGTATADHEQRPGLSASGRGVGAVKLRDLGEASGWKKRPALSQGGGRGVGRTTLAQQLPNISGDSGDSGATGRGVHAGHVRTEGLFAWMAALSERLRWVRVCCGDFERVLGPSVTTKIGLTGVLLDAPYRPSAGRDPSIYAEEDLTASDRAREWALAHGNDPRLRIALCGYEGEHEMPASWQCVPWKASGGYAAAAGNTENAHRERIWFSPHCLKVDVVRAEQRDLFPAEASGG